MVDGSIDKADYDVRKQNYDFELKQLREELTAIEQRKASEADIAELIELATNLSHLYSATPVAKKRAMIRNCFRSVLVVDGVLVVAAAAWLTEIETGGGSRNTKAGKTSSGVFAALASSEIRALQPNG